MLLKRESLDIRFNILLDKFTLNCSNSIKFFKENSGQNRVSLLELGGYKFFYEWPICGLILGGYKNECKER